MKMIKRLLYSTILSIIVLTVAVPSVSAFDVGDKFSEFAKTTNSGSKLKLNKRNYGNDLYSAKYDKDNKNYTLYCMDPGSATPNNLVVSRLLLSQKGVAAEDFGIATIVTASESDGFKTKGSNFNAAKGLAIRTFINGYLSWPIDSSDDNALDALKSASASWEKGEADAKVTGNADVIEDAKKLYLMGVEAKKNYSAENALDVKTEVVEISSEDDATGEITNEPIEDNPNKFSYGGSGNNTQTSETTTGPKIKEINKKFIIKVSLKNFDAKEGVFKFDSFTGGSGENVATKIVGISTENTTDFTKFTTPISYGTNVFETFKDSVIDNGNNTLNLELFVAVETTGTVEFDISTEDSDETVCEESCREVDGKLKYTYSDPKSLIGAVLYNADKGISGSQRFVVASNEVNQNSEEIDIPVKACAKECANPSKCAPVICKDDECEYDSTLPQLCSDDTEVDENGLVEYKFIEAYTQNGYSIVKCLLGSKKDAADNPYKLEDDDNAKAVMDNPYCSILCKEDYSIKLPYKQVAEEGRYFKLSLSLKGQQDCYSTKFDTKKFNEDIIAKEKELIDALNIWNVYFELVNKDKNSLRVDINNYESCDKLTCDPNASANDGCQRGTEESTPYADDSAWYVHKGTMVWGQHVDAKYYQIDTTTGQISLASGPSSLPDDVIVDYGYIEKQTHPESQCNFRDNNIKKALSSHYASGFISVDGVSLEFKKSGSTLDWRLNNRGNETSIFSSSYLVRGYNSGDDLLFQRRLTVSARANSEGTGNIPIDGSTTKISIVSYDDDIYGNVSCSAAQTPCPKVSAAEHFESMRPTYEQDLELAKIEVEKKVEELKEIIDQYNSCVGDKSYQALSQNYNGSAFWEMIYKYDPEIKYSYDEPDPTDSEREKWIDQVQQLTCEDGTCDIMYAKNENVTAEDCPDEGSTNCTALGADGMISSVFADQENDKELSDDFDNETELDINSSGITEATADTHVNTYCIGDVNDDYSCKGETLHGLDETSYEDKPFFMCNYEDGLFKCEEEKHPLTKINYIHKAASAQGDYDTRLVYYTGHDDGNIKISYSEQPILNYSLVQGLPVSADTPQGTYIYILNIENIGTFYNTGALGRIYGSDPKSLSTYARGFQDNEKELYPITVGSGEEVTDIFKEIDINEYACTYTVSQSTCTDPEGNIHTIDECDFGGAHSSWAECQKDICNTSSNPGTYCVKESESYYICNGTSYDKDSCRKVSSRAEALASATYNYNCCPDCEVICVGKCLYVFPNDKPKDGTLQYDFRTVSPQNMNPNSRKLGYNWDSANASNSLVAQKASNTIAEIEARASAGNNQNINIEAISEYKLKVTMTPDMVTWIKEYNNEQSSQGAYNNDSLECYNYDLDGYNEEQCKSSGYIWEDSKCIMANVFCYSTFIDELGAAYPEQVDAPHRSEAKNSAYDNFKTYTGIANQGQSIITNDYWTIYKYDNLDINGDGLPDIGPSWK